MFVVDATAGLLAHLKAGTPGQAPAPTTSLGAWYANTLLPVLLPPAAARTLGERFPAALEQVLVALGAPAWFVEAELAQMDTYTFAKTANRGTIGMLNEFGFLADAHRDGPGTPDLTALAVRLAGTPCGPLYKSHVFPERALAAHIAGQVPPGRRLRIVGPDDDGSDDDGSVE